MRARDVARKKGKKNRKHGKGDRKVSHSKWGSYESLMNHQKKLRRERLSRSFCEFCNIQFHSKNAFKRHDCSFLK